MNINIVLDSDYICQKFSTLDGMKEMDKLFLIIKKKSNIIIIQDKNGKIVNKILKKLNETINEIPDLQLPYLTLFIAELAKGTTNEYDFVTNEQFENDTIKFVEKLKSKNYPLNIIISDKNFNDEIDVYPLDKTDLIFDVLENYSKEYEITNNKEMLNKNDEKKDNKQLMINFDQYQDFLINTFWCSKKIVIVAKEFYDGFFSKNRDGFPNEQFRSNNRDRYSEGFKFLFNCFEKIEIFTGEKPNIEIITGITIHDIADFNLNGKKNANEVISFLEKLNNNFIFSLKIYEWNAGDERFPGKGHGRRIFSEYGGFKTEYMPFEIHSKRDKNNKIFYKNTSCQWIGKKNYLNPEEFGVLKYPIQP
jgi:hypothetical protein